MAIISEKNEESLREVIKHILYNPSISKTLSERGKRMAANQFDWGVVIERILDLYHKTIGIDSSKYKKVRINV